MSPELYLQVTYLLNRFLHFPKETLEFNDISKFRIYILMLHMILLDVFFDDVLIPENCELLL